MRKRAKLDFENSFFLTNISDAAWNRAFPVIFEAISREQKKVPASRLRAWFNAILYLSFSYRPWKKVKDHKQVEALYRRLKGRSVLGILQRIAHKPYPLEIKRPVKRKEERRKRKCSACPRCGEDSMRCYSSHIRGSCRVRNYRCTNCGHISVWIDNGNAQWWRNPYPGFRNNAQY